MSDEEKEMLRALNALRLEVPPEIAVDVADKVKAHSRAQGERIERLRAALSVIALNMERAYGTVGLDRKELLAKMLDAGRLAVEALKEDNSHV